MIRTVSLGVAAVEEVEEHRDNHCNRTFVAVVYFSLGFEEPDWWSRCIP